MNSVPLFRYPGGKQKLCTEVVRELQCRWRPTYCEPFCGGAGICLCLLPVARLGGGLYDRRLERVWLNDIDPDICALWYCIIHKPDALIRAIREFKPTVEIFNKFKTYLLDGEYQSNQLIRAFMKLVVHQLSYSGLGTMAGPLGGEDQISQYRIDDRWSPTHLIEQIRRAHRGFAAVKTRCTAEDFEVVLRCKNAMHYLDPPYYDKGPELYQYSFTRDDHERLADVLHERATNDWVLSYDDHPKIRKMYRWARIKEVDCTYTIKLAKDAKRATPKRELIITQE